jgi:hypothetical protein
MELGAWKEGKMSRRRIEMDVAFCRECPWVWLKNTGGYFCDNPNNMLNLKIADSLEEDLEIPEWCPLPYEVLS